MNLRLDKNAVFWTNGQNIHDALVYGHEDPTRIDACCNFYENVMDLNQNTVVH